MGVPKFFRYTSERYPCLNELVKQYQIPDFDHMYLDMNGIIHNCSHPDDSNPHFRITEEKIFEDIFHYISILFQIIKPKKLFFMAIDGVAPRAKMNQQRGRRFRSAREADRLEEEAKNKGETLPTEKRFDSNCITPGTVFMARLHEQLRFFVKRKITCDPLWAKVKVVLSGHETPGEGEHKIMDYIRWARSQPEYDPNTRHCLYGLDADLIMLGMCTHEPHFALLREEVKFGRNEQRVTSPEETNFYLLHLSLLKEYLEQEFIAIKDSLPFPYDIEKIVDDWVLMGFLVGNDFIPNLPNMHIGNEAVPLLYKTYMKVLPTLNGYINEAGELNLQRFEIFMQELAKIDKEMFQETFVDLQYFEAKTGRRPNANDRKEYKPNDDETFNVNVDDIKAQPDDDLQALINATDELFMDDEKAYDGDSSDEGDPIGDVDAEFQLHKRDYYMTKLDYSSVTDEVLADQAEGYVRAIQWNLYYYYKGCPSWCWYYPHHYAPYMSDIKGFKDLKIEFELGDPFKPFEQLLAVLPAASRNLLPTPFHDLMTDEDSAIVHYYPVNFESDLNGKVNDWEAVVLIPFIDEVNLLSAMAPCYQRLTEEELKRNTHGPMLVYNWIATSQGPATAPEYFPPLEESHALELFVWRKDLEVPLSMLKRGVLPNARTDMLYPGFPTMRHLKYKSSLKGAKVRVFDQPSRNNNMIVEILNDEKPSLEAVAQELLGQTIWVGWPHLTRAKVISVSNEKMRLHHVGQQNNNIDSPAYTTEINTGNLHQQWLSERTTIVEHNFNRLGIELGPVNIIVHAINHKGYKYIIQDNSKMVLEPEFCSVPCGYALQAIVTNVSAYIMEDVGRFSTPQEAYPPGEQVFLLTQGQYYGCQATVVDSEAIRSGRIKVSLCESIEPTPVANVSVSPYNTANHASAACGITANLLARITGVVLIAVGEKNSMPSENQNKINVGLNLKLNKKNLEVGGYTRKCTVTHAWLYSHRCVELVSLYARKYPELFDRLSHANYNDLLFESDVWPHNAEDKKLAAISTWLKSLPHSKATRRECGTECLEPEEMVDLADCLDEQLKGIKQSEKKVTLQVKWSLLYKPELYEGNIQPDPKADYKLYDRVVCVAKNITVPFGAKGTVTALHPAPNANTVRLSDKLNADGSYQVMFDEGFAGAIFEEGFSSARFYRMQSTHMLNLSYGRKLRDAVTTVQKSNQDALGFTYNTANTNQSNNRSNNRSSNQSNNRSNNRSSIQTATRITNDSSNQPTNILRRGDGLNSAFASYSPPVDKKTSPFENRNNNSNVTPTSMVNASPAAADKNGLQPDNATHLLKSLLKISENECESKKNKNTQEQNWRVKDKRVIDPPAPSQPQPSRMQQPTNWRKEQAAQNNAKQQPGPNTMEWSNSNFKNQPPPLIPPFPTFGAMPVPGPTQIPFPQFQNPKFNPRQPNQNPRQPNQTQRQLNQAFPKHLPNVGGNNVTLGPSWMGQNVKPPAPGSSNPQNGGQSSADKLSNPFVPLQVQTSRRRIQNSSGTSTKKDTGEIVVPQYVLPKTEPQVAPVNNQQPLASKPSKKKKPRIAANLPFQMD